MPQAKKSKKVDGVKKTTTKKRAHTGSAFSESIINLDEPICDPWMNVKAKDFKRDHM